MTARSERVAVIVDSAASVPEEFRDSPLTRIVPMRLHIGAETYRDGVDISPADFYQGQRQNAEAVSTSAPTPADFLDAYAAASEVSGSALTILVSGAFSAAGRSAELARQEFSETHPGFQIRTLDSQSAAGGQGLVAWEALKASLAGCGLEQTEARALEIRSRVRLIACVDTLYYLWKSGRVAAIAHLGTSLLKLKPIFELSQSQVLTLAKPRTDSRAGEKMIELMAERVGNSTVHAVIMHVSARERALLLRDAVEERFDCAESFVTEFTPVMGAHIGPGMVGAAFWAEK